MSDQSIYLGKTAIVIDIKDPGVEVAVKGTTLTVTRPDRESVKVEPGDEELKITSAGLETTTKGFSLKKGETKTVTVSIVDKQIVARLGNQVLPLTPSQEEKASNPATNCKKRKVPRFHRRRESCGRGDRPVRCCSAARQAVHTSQDDFLGQRSNPLCPAFWKRRKTFTARTPGFLAEPCLEWENTFL